MTERTGEAFELGEALTVIGNRLTPGVTAPVFELDWLNREDSAMHTVRLADTVRQVRLLNLVNSVDTPICHIETRRWAMAEDVSHALLSAHRSTQFGEDYGVLLKEWRLLQRAVFVIDRAGQIVHAEYVADQMTEPDYNAATAAARRASGA